MKKILEWICGPKPETINKYNQLTISVDNNGKIVIKFDINNFSNHDAKNFGLMLYYMNEGLYVETILDLLTQSTDKNTNYTNFIEKTISSWSTKVSESYKDDEDIADINSPIVSPSDFYKKTGYVK